MDFARSTGKRSCRPGCSQSRVLHHLFDPDGLSAGKRRSDRHEYPDRGREIRASGAGRGAKVANLFCEVNENIKAYGVTTHRHTPEIEEQLSYAAGGPVLLNFTPHLVPMNRGILATEYASLKKPVTMEEVGRIYQEYYGGERLSACWSRGPVARPDGWKEATM